jgi:ribosomal protein S18 acetylase RimI-like enzyme
VVVRRLVAGEIGPSGGPAMTDVLGVCLAWGPDVCVVRPESGRPVEISLDDIVAGKPVPPRASVRQRVSPRDSERHSLPMWPHVERRALGEWELRTDPAPVGRLLKRANSCLAIGDPGVPVADAAAQVVSFYVARQRDALAQVVLGSETEQALARLGWRAVPGGDSHFLVTSVAMALRLVPRDGDVELEEDGPRARVVRRVAGQGIGSARAALDGDWLGIHSLGVEPHHRGYGHASAMTAALLEWGAEHGATTVWLHVETDNVPALAMYDKLGFAVHHSCRYLTAPTGGR